MAKRFTDTTKWDRAWFRKLSPKLKCAWDYLCTKCDHAGIWQIDVEAMCFNVGDQFTLEEIGLAFPVQILQGEKLFIETFIEFQYNCSVDELNEANKVHASIISILRKEGIIKPLASPFQGAKDKDKDKDKDKEEEPEKKISPLMFEELYNSYPLKKGKTKGLKACHAQIKSRDDLFALSQAITRYRQVLERDRTDAKYIKHFDTFMNCWRDYLDDDVGTSVMTGIIQNRGSICAVVKE